MKKLSILCGIALVLALISGTVLADSFQFDFNGDQSWDTVWYLDPLVNETVAMDIYFADYSPTIDMFGTQLFLHYDNSKVQVNMVNSSIDNTCWDSSWNTLVDLGGGVISIASANLSCCPVTGGKIMIAQIELECIGTGDSNIETTFTGTPTGSATDCDDGDITPVTHASAIITQAPTTAGCTSNADCGTDGYIGDEYCSDGDVYRDSRTYTCNNPGTQDAYCSNEDTGIMQEDCDYGCENGGCLPEGGCLVTLKVEDITAHPGEVNFQVPVSMKNPSDEVLAIETILLDEDNCLICTGCTPDPVRAPGFMCFAYEQPFGECKVIMANLSADGPIAKGDGTVFTVDYTANCNPPSDDCITIAPVEEDTIIADACEDPVVPVCVVPGKICFITCGDVYPGGDDCGDGAVNIFDILEEIDIVLGIVENPSECQVDQGDVPTGVPTCEECTLPDGAINIFDILVIIDKALDKPNCCDCYYFDECD